MAAINREGWQQGPWHSTFPARPSRRKLRILHRDFVLVLGNGTAFTHAQLIDSARNPIAEYEKQVEMPGTQKVRLFGKDTAVVTALRWLKRTRDSGKSAFDCKLWFSDTCVRTLDGWKCAFGQASLRLPNE